MRAVRHVAKAFRMRRHWRFPVRWQCTLLASSIGVGLNPSPTKRIEHHATHLILRLFARVPGGPKICWRALHSDGHGGQERRSNKATSRGPKNPLSDSRKSLDEHTPKPAYRDTSSKDTSESLPTPSALPPTFTRVLPDFNNTRGTTGETNTHESHTATATYEHPLTCLHPHRGGGQIENTVYTLKTQTV